MTPKKRIETARTKEKKGPTKTITEGEMAEFAKDAENSRTLENNARQRTQTAIFAGFRGTGHELARKKGKIETTTTEAEDKTTTTTTTTTITTTTMAKIEIGTISTMTAKAEMGAHHHIIQGHTTMARMVRTNNQ